MTQPTLFPTDPSPEPHPRIDGSAFRALRFKQVDWARRRGIPLQGSADNGSRGYPSYCPTVESNLYHGSLTEATNREFQAASGQEVRTGKMACTWSSSTLA